MDRMSECRDVQGSTRVTVPVEFRLAQIKQRWKLNEYEWYALI